MRCSVSSVVSPVLYSSVGQSVRLLKQAGGIPQGRQFDPGWRSFLKGISVTRAYRPQAVLACGCGPSELDFDFYFVASGALTALGPHDPPRALANPYGSVYFTPPPPSARPPPRHPALLPSSSAERPPRPMPRLPVVAMTSATSRGCPLRKRSATAAAAAATGTPATTPATRRPTTKRATAPTRPLIALSASEPPTASSATCAARSARLRHRMWRKRARASGASRACWARRPSAGGRGRRRRG